MQYAVIDVGSNTIRLSIYNHTQDAIEQILTQKEVAGLAQYITDGVMEPEGIQRVIDTLKSFQSIALKFVEPDHLRAFSAAALRSAQNRDTVVQRVSDDTGIQLELISGDEEARLDFVGVMHFNSVKEGMILDIGGASAELVRIVDGQITALTSLPVGCLSLYKRYVRKVLPSESEYKDIRKAVREQFDTLHWDEDVECPLVVGVGGTLRAMSKLAARLAMIEPGQKEVQVKTAMDILKCLRKNSLGILNAVYKTSPERIPTLIPGLVICKEAIKRFGCKAITVSAYGVREGFLIDRMLDTPLPAAQNEGEPAGNEET
jgi:exopolyphosphatase/guanosine-5'-triphosphate,3'-diphosphate pyrophosphatase